MFEVIQRKIGAANLRALWKLRSVILPLTIIVAVPKYLSS